MTTTIRSHARMGIVLGITLPLAAAGVAAAATLTADRADTLVTQARDAALLLDDVTGITPDVAMRLGKHGQGLSLDGLATLDPQSAGILALHGRLTDGVPQGLDIESLLGRIADLADGEDGPDFEGLERLIAELGAGVNPDEPEVNPDEPGQDPAESGSAESDPEEPPAPTGDAWLSLGGLTSITPEVAAALALHEGPLLLDGVETLSVAAAEALAAHGGELSLAGLKSLPADVRDALATHAGTVVLPDELVTAVADE